LFVLIYLNGNLDVLMVQINHKCQIIKILPQILIFEPYVLNFMSSPYS